MQRVTCKAFLNSNPFSSSLFLSFHPSYWVYLLTCGIMTHKSNEKILFNKNLKLLEVKVLLFKHVISTHSWKLSIPFRHHPRFPIFFSHSYIPLSYQLNKSFDILPIVSIFSFLDLYHHCWWFYDICSSQSNLLGMKFISNSKLWHFTLNFSWLPSRRHHLVRKFTYDITFTHVYLPFIASLWHQKERNSCVHV